MKKAILVVLLTLLLVPCVSQLQAMDKKLLSEISRGVSYGIWEYKKFKALLVLDADPDIKDVNGNTALHRISNEYDNPPKKIVQLFINHGANVNAKNKLGATPLHTASINGHLEIVQLLIKYDANPNLQNNLGKTPLHNAAYAGHSLVTQFLLQYNAKPYISDKNSCTALHLAAIGMYKYKNRNYIDTIKYLLQKNADPNAQTTKYCKIGGTHGYS